MTASAPTAACDPGDELGDPLDDLEYSLRDGACNPLLAKCDYRNNFYLGLSEYGIDNLPLVAGSDPDIAITEIRAYQCIGHQGMPVVGDFHVVDPHLSVDDDGNFQAMVFEHVAFPWVRCKVDGQYWLGTDWLITAKADNAVGVSVTVDARLRIADLSVSPGQSTLYQWESDHNYLYGDSSLTWEPTCDEDPDPALDFHAVVYPSLRIDDGTGEFTLDKSTAYLGCTSGLVAKSGYTWGYYAQPPSVHQVMTYAGMASYCGPLGQSYTETGTTIAVWNKTASGPDQLPIDPVTDPLWTPEAAWDASMTAICIGKTRLDTFQPDPGKDFDCGSFSIPPCAEDLLDDPSVMFITYAHN
ncbi:MAG: hypothetical protein K0V04_46715 [Deltaproteobacteria bacterium]|nr:hypothetical protein [Deltaproteobacteria bacterium]